jgi:phage-related baseplate assembly protein
MENLSNPPESEDVVVFKRSHFYSILVVFAFAAGILIGYLAWGRDVPVTQVVAAPAQAVPAAATVQPDTPSFTRYDIPTEGFPSIGPEDAEIVLVEFGDFQ